MTLGTVRSLAVLDFGLFRVTAATPPRLIGIPGFLILTDTGRHILFDTGFPPAYADDPGAAAQRDGLPRFGHLVGHDARRTLAGQLARLGLATSDIDLTVLSHGHIDHVGGLSQLTHAPIVLTARERAEPRPLYFGEARPIAWPDAEYRTLDRPTDLCPGLTLIPTPGHTPGHLSALVTLPRSGPLLLAADALSRPSEPAEGFPEAIDPAAAVHSAALLHDLARQTGARLIYGHCPRQWPQLPKAPAVLD
jgi:N-acyl homoserine lactone hydrolase